jgi:hypothetical protein
MKSTQLYDFTLAAGGSQVILADANFYKVLTSTGDLKITRDGGSTVRPMRAGRGEREVDFQRLTVTDISGAPNSGTIVVGDSNFIDDTIVLSSAINTRPESAGGSFLLSSAIVANNPDTVFSAASNTAGAIVLYASFSVFGNAVAPSAGFLHKATAPTTSIDGSPVLISGMTDSSSGASCVSAAQLGIAQLVPAGQGLFFISDAAGTAGGGSYRGCRYKLL